MGRNLMEEEAKVEEVEVTAAEELVDKNLLDVLIVMRQDIL